MPLAHTLYHWIDLAWLPVALVAVEKNKRLLTVFFVLACVSLLRLQIELMEKIGFPRGIFHWLEASLFERGLIVYGGFIALFLLLSRFSPGVDNSIHIAASITMMIAAFCVCAATMVL